MSNFCFVLFIFRALQVTVGSLKSYDGNCNANFSSQSEKSVQDAERYVFMVSQFFTVVWHRNSACTCRNRKKYL